MLERRKFIKKYLNEFIPPVISNLISDYDYQLIGKCDLTLRGHTGKVKVTSCNVISDGKTSCKIISLSDDGKLKIWNSQTGQCELSSYVDSFDWATSFAILFEYKIVCGSMMGQLQIWNIHTKKFELRFHGHEDEITCCARISNERFVSGSMDGTLKIWNTQIYEFNKKELKCELIFGGNFDRNFQVTCCAIINDNQIISGSMDGNLQIWNIKTGECELILKDDIYMIDCCSVFANYYNDRVVSGSGNTLKIWNIKTGECELTLKGHTNKVTCFSFLPNGQIISGSKDDTLKIWNTKVGPQSNQYGECEKTLKLSHTVSCCAVLNDGRIIYGANDGLLQILS